MTTHSIAVCVWASSDADRTIRFLPIDGELELMKYHSSAVLNHAGIAGTRHESSFYFLKARVSLCSPRLFATNVVIKVLVRNRRFF
ncbi:hypothetical protein PsorP6_007025 [Peronosclerospora sorghi]|uniref:Uncharacterized protein n=1 Tax=Peronosclerospora sorghi TaxID=230839 RepID=A0ACC0W890_9STRA|nr:hypothetical protein PsorP6_007025 [Peronosclerospora sorghi]